MSKKFTKRVVIDTLSNNLSNISVQNTERLNFTEELDLLLDWQLRGVDLVLTLQEYKEKKKK